MKTKPVRIHLLERPLANAIAPGGIGDAQRRAIWAKRNNPAAGGAQPRSMTQTTPTPVPHQLITVAPTPFPGQLVSKAAPASSLRILVGADGSKQFVQPVTPPAQHHAVLPVTPPPVSQPPATAQPSQQRKWGESRPGEMYFQVEGPGNPSWEKRHPELAPAGGSVAPPQHHLLETPPTKTPRASSDIPYGSDARTVPAAPAAPPNSQPAAPARTLIPVPSVPIPGYPKGPPQTGASESIAVVKATPDAPVDPYQAIRDKIDRIRQGLPADPPPAPRPPAYPLAVAPPPRTATPTPGHPNPDKPYQTPPYIPPLRHGPVMKPVQPPFKVPPGVLRSKPQPKPVGPPLKFPKAKKSYVKNWYRGAIPQ